MSYDNWKQTDPADRSLGRSNGQPVVYRCLTCGWRLKGSIERAKHVTCTGHTLVVPKEDPRFNQCQSATGAA